MEVFWRTCRIALTNVWNCCHERLELRSRPSGITATTVCFCVDDRLFLVA